MEEDNTPAPDPDEAEGDDEIKDKGFKDKSNEEMVQKMKEENAKKKEIELQALLIDPDIYEIPESDQNIDLA